MIFNSLTVLSPSRFGIEMVPCEQEDQSQEEDDIPLLEGFQWESLIDMSGPAASRKRSLSESSLAPASAHALFPSHMSKEKAQREGLSSEQQGSFISPKSLFAQEKDSQQEVEKMLSHYVSKEQRQPEKITSGTVKALQRSDSVLGDSSSGTEQLDGQGTGKRRRAAAVSKGNCVKTSLCEESRLFVLRKQAECTVLTVSSFCLSGCPKPRDVLLGTQ